MDTETIIHEKSEAEPKGRLVKSARSFYDSFRENVITNAGRYSYYTSIITLVVLIILFYCNYSLFSTSGFFWLMIETVLVMFMVWQNTMLYLKL